ATAAGPSQRRPPSKSGPRRLVDQDAALSRLRSRVRIPPGLLSLSIPATPQKGRHSSRQRTTATACLGCGLVALDAAGPQVELALALERPGGGQPIQGVGSLPKQPRIGVAQHRRIDRDRLVRLTKSQSTDASIVLQPL